MEFQSFNLTEETKRAIADAGYENPTEIQEKSIPLMLEGKDIIGYSQTGSGKTAAFGLPAIDMIDFEVGMKRPQILILCPTRELAIQAKEELLKFSKYKQNLHIVAIYGGQPIDVQIGQLRRGCQIIVGTPGRVMDHIRRKTLRFDNLKMVVLDEADEMLNMGFREDIETILKETPEERQTVLFSATMPQEILDITKNYQKNPELIEIKRSAMTVSTIEQSYFDVPRGKKKEALSILLQYYKPSLSIVFCNTKKMTQEICEYLIGEKYRAAALHGDMKQSSRTQVMNRFKNGGFDILVATDVAARGIDVNDIDIVFNFDIPQDPEYYIHRIGRTGRAGKEGKSFTLVQGRGQYNDLRGIAKYAKCQIDRKELPMLDEIKKQNTDLVVDEIKKEIESSNLTARENELNTLLEFGFTTEQVALALLDLKMKKKETTFKNFNNLERCDFSQYKERKTKEKPRKKRTPNKRAEKKFEGVDMSKVTISIGRKDKVAPKHILGAVAGESGLPGSIMGTIEINKTFTTIDVPKEYKKRIVKALNNSTIKNVRVTAK